MQRPILRYLTLALLLWLLSGGAPARAARPPAVGALVIRGVLDGPLPNGLPKLVELLALADIPDLNQYGLGSANNGEGSDGVEFVLPAGSVAAGTSIFVATEATGFTQWFGFAPDYTSDAVRVNGNDAIELFLSGNVVDTFGEIDSDGIGRPWEYSDGWACRLNNSGPDGATFQITNWRFSGPDALDAATTNATAAAPYPLRPTPCSGSAPPDTPPSVSATVPADGAAEISPEITLIVQFSEPVAFGGAQIVCDDGITRGSLMSGGPATYNIKPTPALSLADRCTVTLPAAQVHDLDGAPDALAADHVFSFTTAGAPRDEALVLRGVIDGPLPDGMPKAVELLALADIADLSRYGLGVANNGEGSDGQEFTFPAAPLAAGSTIFVAYESSGFAAWFGFAPTYVSGHIGINGDDAVELFAGGQVIDTFGDIHRDGSGQAWEYTDGWACRIAGSGPDGVTFTPLHWRFSGPNVLDGETSNPQAHVAYPLLPQPCGASVPTATTLVAARTDATRARWLPIGLLTAAAACAAYSRRRRRSP